MLPIRHLTHPEPHFLVSAHAHLQEQLNSLMPAAGMWQSIAWCIAIDVLYVGALYVKRTPASRQHPTTIKWRMASVAAISCIAWLPAWLRRKQLLAATPTYAGPVPSMRRRLLSETPGLRQLLGLQVDALLLPAVLWPLLLTVVLFSGPLLHRACLSWQQQQQWQHCDWRAWWQLLKPSLYIMRDCVVAPVTEEWCFRACMVPLLWMEGASCSTITFMTPLFFGLGHLHHARELLTVHHWPLQQVVQVVCFQLLYTTVFGWYATWVFMATGKFAAAVMVHSFCNMMGVPAFGSMAAHPQGSILLVTTAAGVAAFGFGLWKWSVGASAVYRSLYLTHQKL